MKRLLDSTQPLAMPQGSVRALLAFTALVGFIFGRIPIEIMTLVLGFYFVERATDVRGD